MNPELQETKTRLLKRISRLKTAEGTPQDYEVIGRAKAVEIMLEDFPELFDDLPNGEIDEQYKALRAAHSEWVFETMGYLFLCIRYLSEIQTGLHDLFEVAGDKQERVTQGTVDKFLGQLKRDYGEDLPKPVKALYTGVVPNGESDSETAIQALETPALTGAIWSIQTDLYANSIDIVQQETEVQDDEEHPLDDWF